MATAAQFYDESGFNLNTNVPYAWQHKASEFTLPAKRGNIVTVAGFLRTDNSFEAYYAPGSMDTDLFMGYIEDFIQKRVNKKTILILDRVRCGAHLFIRLLKYKKSYKYGRSRICLCSSCLLIALI